MTAVVIVRRQHGIVGTSVTAVVDCSDTFVHCIDIAAVLTPEDWCVQSVIVFQLRETLRLTTLWMITGTPSCSDTD